jgi:hypothetical protein
VSIVEWILIIATAHNFLSVWLMAGVLEKILRVLEEMNKGDDE